MFEVFWPSGVRKCSNRFLSHTQTNGSTLFTSSIANIVLIIPKFSVNSEQFCNKFSISFHTKNLDLSRPKFKRNSPDSIIYRPISTKSPSYVTSTLLSSLSFIVNRFFIYPRIVFRSKFYRKVINFFFNF